MRNRFHSSEAVGLGIVRFLEDLRLSQSFDAEAEFAEPCRCGRGYPAAIDGQCFSCLSAEGKTC